MKSNWILPTLLFAAPVFLGLSLMPLGLSAKGKACARTQFKTKRYQNACRKGGQKYAKKVARKFVKQAKKRARRKITCRTCHIKSSGKYPLKKNGLKLFKQWGGR